jgi:hypothetical protein
MAPQQIVAATSVVTEGALLDQWGRIHPLEATTEVGRTLAANGIAIFDVSVSRHHARITRARGTWLVCDNGSSNGTFVNQEAVVERSLCHGDQICFGRVAFYAVFDIGRMASSPEPVVITCVAPVTAKPPGALLRIVEPSGGNGGFVELANASAQLTAAQLELVELLRRRMRDDAHLPPAVRGFVRSSELVGVLSWDTHNPDDTHVKQLVRRVRRTLIRSGLGDLIESRHRLGYRLRVIPASEPRRANGFSNQTTE